jgi:hypothetical protein
MAFDVASAKKAGYSDQEIQNYLLSQQSPVQQGANALRSIGLGAIPDILGAGQFGIQKLLAGKNPFSSAGETPQQLQAETSGNQLINPQSTGGGLQAGKDLAGATSWMIPETKLLKGGNILQTLLAGAINRGAQGAIQGELASTAQGENPINGAITGAVTNPLLSGAGKALTDVLPRYIGLRNFGPAGLKLPEVTKAENAAGGQTLKDVRGGILDNIKPFTNKSVTDATSPMGGDVLSQDRFGLMDKIKALASQPEWVGTPGLSELKKTGQKAFAQPVGVLSNIQSAIQNSKDPFEAYSRIKNMAYPNDNSPASTRIANFLRAASSITREHLINSSDNPATTRKAMDLYAAQTAMGRDSKGKNIIANIIGDATRGGPSADLGAAGIAAVLPALHGLAGIPLADYAVTNPITGPTLARGLVNAGDTLGKTGIGDILRRLGISGAQGVVNSQNQ